MVMPSNLRAQPAQAICAGVLTAQGTNEIHGLSGTRKGQNLHSSPMARLTSRCLGALG